MAYMISIAAANTILDAFLTPFANGVIEIRNGVRPATPDTAATGIALATILLGATPFNAATGRSATLSISVNDPLGNANGAATWFRMYDTSVTAAALSILDGTVGAVASGADMELDDGAGGTAITTVDLITVSAMTVTM